VGRFWLCSRSRCSASQAITRQTYVDVGHGAQEQRGRNWIPEWGANESSIARVAGLASRAVSTLKTSGSRGCFQQPQDPLLFPGVNLLRPHKIADEHLLLAREAFDVISPKLQHPLPLFRILGPVVDSTDAANSVVEGCLNHVAWELLFVQDRRRCAPQVVNRER
jgi:hypothetical protein